MMRSPSPERAAGSLRCLKMAEECRDFDARLKGFADAVRRRARARRRAAAGGSWALPGEPG
jgi:hypothetical protein